MNSNPLIDILFNGFSFAGILFGLFVVLNNATKSFDIVGFFFLFGGSVVGPLHLQRGLP